MKEQFEMKLPKRSETSDFVKEQEKITCPRVCGTKSEAQGVPAPPDCSEAAWFTLGWGGSHPSRLVHIAGSWLDVVLHYNFIYAKFSQSNKKRLFQLRIHF